MLKQEHPKFFTLIRQNLSQFPFLLYMLNNVETSIESADLGLMTAYAQLVTDASLRTRIFSEIRMEFEKTKAMLTAIFGGDFEKRRPRAFKTLSLRAQALKVLHIQQIALLKEWRHCQQLGDKEGAERMVPKLLTSINAISNGLRATG